MGEIEVQFVFSTGTIRPTSYGQYLQTFLSFLVAKSKTRTIIKSENKIIKNKIIQNLHQRYNRIIKGFQALVRTDIKHFPNSVIAGKFSAGVGSLRVTVIFLIRHM